MKGVWDKLEQIKAEREAREAEQVAKPQVDGSKTQQLHEAWRMNQALRDGKSPAELGLPVQASKEATDLRSRLDKYAHDRGTPEGAPRDSAADSALRELVSRLEAAKAPVEAKPEVDEGRVQDSEIKNAPGTAAEKAAPVEVAREGGKNPYPPSQPTATFEKTTPTEPAPPKSPRKSPPKSPGKLPGKSALAKEMEAMGLDFTKPEDYATYRIMKLIEGGKPLPQEKATKKAKAKSETVDKDAEARLAEDLAREESKARKRVEEEKARDEAPEVEPEGEETRPQKNRGHDENPSDSKGKSKAEGGQENVGKTHLSEKPAPKPKKSTPSTPEQAAKEALWKFQAAHAEGCLMLVHELLKRFVQEEKAWARTTGARSRKRRAARPFQ